MKKGMLALALCLLLTGCGGGEEAPAGDAAPAAEGLGHAAGVDENAPLFTVDGREVPAWRYLCWLSDVCGQVREQYQAAGLTLDWGASLDQGTLADYAKEQALADAALYATVENWAERYGCALTEEERASAAGTESAPYRAELEALGLNPAQAAELAGVGLEYAKLSRLCASGDSPLSPDEAALAAYEEKSGALTVDRILAAAGEDREAARERASELFSRLNGAEDQASAFTALAKEGDDAAGPRTLDPGGGTLAPSLVEAARALEAGQCSGILESEEGFSILRRLPPDAAALAEGYFDDALQSAAAAAQIVTTEAYEGLDAAAFAAALPSPRPGGLSSP